MKDYSYRKKKLTIPETDIEELHRQIDEFNSMIDSLPRIYSEMGNNFRRSLLDAAESMDRLLVPKVDQVDLIYYLQAIKPHCRSSSYLDE